MRSTATLSVDVRVIAAAKTDLSLKIEDGSFRSDLFYRLNVVPIHIPSLRERREDIPALVEHFIGIHDMRNKIVSIAPSCIEALMKYDWPGNIRELENIVQQMIALSKNEIIELSDIPQNIIANTSDLELDQLVPSDKESISLESTLRGFEKKMLAWALDKSGQNKSLAARILQLSRSTFRSKLIKHGLDSEEEE